MTTNQEYRYDPQQIANDLQYTDFSQWLDARTPEELAHFIAVNEQYETMAHEQNPTEQARKRQELDENTVLRLGMVALHFTDKVQWSQEHLDKTFNKLIAHVGMELASREGVLQYEGSRSLIERQDRGRYVFVEQENQ